MIILTLLFILILGLSIYAFILAFKRKGILTKRVRLLVSHIRSVALLALAFAVFSQILGLVDIFDYLAHHDAGVSSSILAKGIKITFHVTLYGLVIYMVSTLITMGLKFRIRSTGNQD